jgi:hypothetical protein
LADVNKAYKDVTAARQEIETFVLGDDAEVLNTTTFGLPVVEEAEVAEDQEP